MGLWDCATVIIFTVQMLYPSLREAESGTLVWHDYGAGETMGTSMQSVKGYREKLGSLDITGFRI